MSTLAPPAFQVPAGTIFVSCPVPLLRNKLEAVTQKVRRNPRDLVTLRSKVPDRSAYRNYKIGGKLHHQILPYKCMFRRFFSYDINWVIDFSLLYFSCKIVKVFLNACCGIPNALWSLFAHLRKFSSCSGTQRRRTQRCQYCWGSWDFNNVIYYEHIHHKWKNLDFNIRRVVVRS